MKTILELLKQRNIRIEGSGVWLVWDEDSKTWVVYSRWYGQRKTRTIIITANEAQAVAAFAKAAGLDEDAAPQ